LQAAGHTVGTMGYAIANPLAAENLKLGRIVIADCVNPVLASRIGWRQTASQSSAGIVEIELVCSDLALHRQRAESRSPDISGLRQPTWDEIMNRYYEPWDREHLVLDTANGPINDLVDRTEAYVRGHLE
jgi:predicted kinase